MAVQPGPAVESQVPAENEQVLVRRRHVDVSGLDRLIVDGVADGQVARTLEDLREDAGAERSDVEHDEDDAREVGRQLRHERPQRLDAARGRADDERVHVTRCVMTRQRGLQLDCLR